MSELFGLKKFMIRRKILTIFGASFHIYDSNDQVVGFSRQKAFKLKEDIRIFADESMQAELLTIQARQIVDFSAAYDIVDATEGKKVGACRRKGWTSILRDSWELLDDGDNVVGKVIEDSGTKAMLRRLLSNLIPQRFHVSDDDEKPAAFFKQRFNPFVYKLEVEIADDSGVDPRVLMGAAILISAIEGRQG